MMKNKSKKLCTALCLSAFLFAGCSSNVSSHGNQLDPSSLAKIKPGQTRLIEVEALFGRPSARGAFDSGKVYYIAKTMEEKPAGRKETISRTVVAFTYDEKNIIQTIDITDETSGRSIYHASAKTPTPGDNYGIFDQIFRNLTTNPAALQ